jgi:hypothetical protein
MAPQYVHGGGGGHAVAAGPTASDLRDSIGGPAQLLGFARSALYLLVVLLATCSGGGRAPEGRRGSLVPWPEEAGPIFLPEPK